MIASYDPHSLESWENVHLRASRVFSFYIQSFSLTECIVIIGVGDTGDVCLSVCVSVCVCVCLSVCLCRAVSRNYWADFNETFHKWSPIGLVVRVCVSAH